MQVTSAEYKEEQKRDLRNESYVYVYLGIISKEAQANAYITSNLDPISSQDIFQEPIFEAYYAALEDNFTRVDGSFYFQPVEASQYALFQGAVTSSVNGAITFDFHDYHALNIKGLTIDFGDYYPTAFTVTNGTTTYNYTNDHPGIYVLEDVFNSTDYITITPTAMVGGNQRLRIHSIMFGVGLSFDNKTLISTQRRSSIDHLSNSLPVKQFMFTIDNLNKKFNKDNPNSFVNFLQTEQLCTFEYGRKMDDDSIYRIDGGNVALKTWSSNDIQAKFTCVGFLDFMGESFYKGQYRPNGITAYALAQEVLADAGIEDYRIDSYLNRVTLKNPLPITSHKNCLQMIANACRSILYEDRDGRIVIESSFTPEVTSISFTRATSYSNTETSRNSIIGNANTTNYATLEYHYSKVDGQSLRWVRAEEDPNYPWYANGYVSSIVSNENCELTSECSITIEWEAQWTFYGLELTYPSWHAPKTATVIGYANGAEVVTDTTDDPRHFSTEFVECDKIKVIFNTTEYPNQKVHCKHINIGDVSDYNLTYHELAETPIATSIENVKNVDVHHYNFTYANDSQNVSKVNAVKGENLVTFGSPYHTYSVAFTSTTGTLSITESGAYYLKFTSNKAAEVQISAKKIEVTDSTYRSVVSELGGTKVSKNQLIDNTAHAALLGTWIGEYYDSDTEYSLVFRGEPALDCDDPIYLQNNFVDKNLIRITDETLDTGTGMTTRAQKLTARRISYVER